MANEHAHYALKERTVSLSDVPLEARRVAIAQLSETPSSVGPGVFAMILADETDPVCRWYAVRAMGDLRAIEYSELLLHVLRQPDVVFEHSSLHLIAARSIGLLGQAMVPKIAVLLEDGHEQTRLAAVDALGELRDPAGIPTLARCLTSSSRQLRLWSALGLAKIGSPSLSCLADAISTGDSELVFICLDALIMIDCPITMDVIASAAERYPSVCRQYFCGQMLPRAKAYLLKLRHEVNTQSGKALVAARILELLELN